MEIKVDGDLEPAPTGVSHGERPGHEEHFGVTCYFSLSSRFFKDKLVMIEVSR